MTTHIQMPERSARTRYHGYASGKPTIDWPGGNGPSFIVLLLAVILFMGVGSRVEAQTADLQITKAVNDDTPDEGQTITYSINVKNLGPDDATGVQLLDLLPSGMTFSAVSTIDQGTYDAVSGIWDIGAIGDGANLDLVISAIVDGNGATSGTTITNTASIAALDQSDPNPLNDVASATVTVSIPDILVTKVVNDPTPNVGQIIFFTIKAKNIGAATAPATGLVVTDLLPARLTYVPGSSTIPAGTSYDPLSGAWNIGNLPDNVERTLVIAAKPAPGTTAATLTNTATVTALDQPESSLANNTASASVTVNFPDLAVTKSVNDANPSEGQTITYNIIVDNNGDGPATGLQILDQLPAGLTYAATGTIDQGTYDPVTGIWDIGTLSSGANVELVITATVEGNGATSGAIITNTAGVSALNENDPNPADNSASVNIVVNRPDILVTKTVNDNTPDVGQNIRYTITAKNVGTADAPATGLVITDVLPAGLTYVPGSSTIPAGTTYDPVTGAWTIGTLPDNVARTLELAATVNAGQSGFTMINTAAVTAIDQPLEGIAADEASASLTVNFPDIQITMVVTGGPYNEGQPLTYTVNVKNLGPALATGLQVKDLLPGTLSYLSSTPGQGTYDPLTGIWEVGTLNSGADADLTITAFPIVGSSGFDITNTATLFALDQNDTNISNNKASVEIQVATADLLVVKSVNDATPSEGQTIEFSILLDNNGPGDASTIVVEDLLPDGLSFVVFTQIPVGTTAGYDLASKTVTWTTPSLTPGTETLKFTALVDPGFAARTITNTAYVADFDQVDPNRGDNSSSVDLVVNGADLAVTKSVDKQAPNPGETIVYTVTVTNNGPLNANNITLRDILPAGVTLVSSTVSQGDTYQSVNPHEWFVNDIDVGASATMTITATVDAGTVGQTIVNTASILSAVELDSYTDNNTASAVIAVGQADLGITKTASVPSDGLAFQEGETVTYTLVVENDGPDAAPLVEVLDLLPVELTYANHSGGIYDPATGIWSIGTLANGGTSTLIIQATVNTGTAGRVITNSATVSSPMDEPVAAVNPNTGTVTIQVHGADLELVKATTATAPIVEGDAVPYVLTLTNHGPDAATGIEVMDLLPFNLTFVSATASQGAYDETTGLWTGISLASGATATLAIQTTVTSGGGITNTARITASSAGDSFLDNNTSSVFISALKSFEAGACIINMGQIPQTYDNTLKAYGLLYELVRQNQIPVWWAIRPDKTFGDEVSKVDEIDFSVNGVDYRTGAFIIEAEFVYFAQPIIDSWTTLYPTLEINCDQPAFEAPIHGQITSFPRAVLDEQNGGLIESAFYDNIGVQNEILGYYDAPLNTDPIYSLYRPDGLPSNLNACDDIYAMPHADPHTWSETDREVFDAYIKNGGWLWAACHAPSSLETLVDVPSIPGVAPDMNYLTNDGLVLWGDHGDGTLPYSYSLDPGQYASESASDPFMQFIGNIDAALQSGSEQIYIPFATGWRPSTTIAVWDPDHPERTGDGAYPTNAAALVAYGRAYGNPDYGMILYEASHTIASGTEAENVGAARIYGNYLLQAGIEFRPEITPVSLPDEIIAGETATFSVAADGISEPLTYQWISECGGTFSDPNSPTTEFTAPLVDVSTPCVVRLIVTDACNRTNFFADAFILVPKADPEITKTAPATVEAGGMMTYTITVTNNGPSNALDMLVVDDIVAPGVTVINATPSVGIWSAPDWIVGTLAVGAVETLELEVSVDANLANGTILTNSATLSTGSNDIDPSNNIGLTTTTVLAPEITVTKSALETNFSTAGDVIRYQIQVENTGSLAFTSLTVSDPNADVGSVLPLDVAPLDGFNDGDLDLDGILDLGEVWIYTATHTVTSTDLSNGQVLNIATASAATAGGVTVTDDSNEVIVSADDFPIANSDTNVTSEDTPVSGDASTNDRPSGDGGNVWSLVGVDGGAANGTVVMNPDGTYTYTPAADFNGTDSFTYQVCDVDGDCSQATVSITIDPVNDLPVASNDLVSVPEGGSVSIAPLTNDDFGGDGPSTGTITIISQPTNGTATINDGGTPDDPTDDTIDYTPTVDYSGADQITYQICDANGDCTQAVININVLKPELQVEKAGVLDLGADNILNAGDVINYTITVSNTGEVVINTITINDPLIGSLSCTPAEPFTLAPGESTICIGFYVLQQSDIDAGLVTNVATASGLDPNGNTISDTSDDPNDLTNADPDGDGEPDDPTVTILPCLTLEAWVYLEGATIFQDGSENYALPMRTDLNDFGILPGQLLVDPFFGDQYSPSGQPYHLAPWYYGGTEGAGFDSGGNGSLADAGYPSTVVDWILVSLRDTPDGTSGPICQTAALLHKDGRIEFVEDFTCCAINLDLSYYLVIEHRNHLIVMSDVPVDIVNNKLSYDFRDKQSYIDDPFEFGTFVGQKEVLPGIFTMYSGNGNQVLTDQADTDINFDDRTYWEGENGDIGRYRHGDYNLNGDVNFNDRRVWEINNGSFTSTPRN